MSIQNFVFLKTATLPHKKDLEQVLEVQKLPLSLPESFDLNSDLLQCVDATFDGLVCHFDYAVAEYQAKDWSWKDKDLDRFSACQKVAMFNCYSNAQEIMALMISSCVLAHHCEGLLFSPVFHDGLISSDEALGLLNKHYDDIKAQFNGVSKLR